MCTASTLKNILQKNNITIQDNLKIKLLECKMNFALYCLLLCKSMLGVYDPNLVNSNPESTSCTLTKFIQKSEIENLKYD